MLSTFLNYQCIIFFYSLILLKGKKEKGMRRNFKIMAIRRLYKIYIPFMTFKEIFSMLTILEIEET